MEVGHFSIVVLTLDCTNKWTLSYAVGGPKEIEFGWLIILYFALMRKIRIVSVPSVDNTTKR